MTQRTLYAALLTLGCVAGSGCCFDDMYCCGGGANPYDTMGAPYEGDVVTAGGPDSCDSCGGGAWHHFWKRLLWHHGCDGDCGHHGYSGDDASPLWQDGDTEMIQDSHDTGPAETLPEPVPLRK